MGKIPWSSCCVQENVLGYFPFFFCWLLGESGGHGNHFPVHPAFCSRLRYGQNPECPGLTWEGSHENIVLFGNCEDGGVHRFPLLSGRRVFL